VSVAVVAVAVAPAARADPGSAVCGGSEIDKLGLCDIEPFEMCGTADGVADRG